MKLLNVGAEHIDTYLSVAINNQIFNSWSCSLAHSDSNTPHFSTFRINWVILIGVNKNYSKKSRNLKVHPPASRDFFTRGEVGSL